MATTSRFTVPFGRGEISFAMPGGVDATLLRPSAGAPLADPAAAAREAVLRPIGAPPLRELARDARSVVIAVTDATRACPDDLLVPPMLAELAAAGVPDAAITILVAVGTHRASTDAEKREKLGDAIVDRYRVIDHDAADDANLVAIAEGPGGFPVRVNSRVAEADLVLATGRVEPHQYAGFSGGGKTITIGCAGEDIIAYTHGPALLDQPGTRLAKLAGNPFQEMVRRVARAARVRFVANIVMDDENHPVEIAYGAPEAVQDHLAVTATAISTVGIPAQVDIAIAGVGYPKDANLYQASRAASYLQFAPTPVVRDGGVIVIPAECPEGAGEGAGEQRFLAAMNVPGGTAEVIRRARAEGIRPGEQRAYVMALVLEKIDVVVAGVADPDAARAVGFIPAADMDEALAIATRIAGTPARALVIPHALLTLPIIGS